MSIQASGVAAQTALARQDAALGFVKKNASADQQIANVLSSAAEGAAKSAPSGGRGSIVDITV